MPRIISIVTLLAFLCAATHIMVDHSAGGEVHAALLPHGAPVHAHGESQAGTGLAHHHHHDTVTSQAHEHAHHSPDTHSHFVASHAQAYVSLHSLCSMAHGVAAPRVPPVAGMLSAWQRAGPSVPSVNPLYVYCQVFLL